MYMAIYSELEPDNLPEPPSSVRPTPSRPRPPWVTKHLFFITNEEAKKYLDKIESKRIKNQAVIDLSNLWVKYP